jgi:hypothetical protein|tara:strand:- start:3564 stop:3758 length:195 start_codon:yes stop_codon:yes gene_type:complete
MASKQKVKKKKDCMIPSSDSYKGLSYEDWEALNDGQAVELDEVSDTLKPYLEGQSENKQKKGDK